MRKTAIIALISLALLITGCRSNQTNSSAIDAESMPTSSEVSSSPNKGEPVTNEKMTEQEAVEFYSLMISDAYGEEIQEIKCFDLNNDGKFSCAAIVGESDDGIINGSVLFADQNSITEILSDKGLYKTLQIALIENSAIIIAEEGYGGSGSLSHVWKANEESCDKVDRSFMALMHTSGADFSAHMGAFDPWHTYKKYYFYWDGSNFKEYGGILVTEEQLSSVEGGKQAIEKITNSGFSVSEIFYRSNGIININYINGDMYDNMTLIYKNGIMTIDESDDGWYNGGAGNVGGSYGGAYEVASIPEIAVYPDRMPF